MQKTTRLKRPQVPEPGELIDFDDIVGRPKYAGEEMTSETNIPSVTAETEARQAADQEIWTEIETIEASSDVVDVVGTYAELEAYDTSKLHDKDLIKVLQDETRDNAITYYRYSTTSETFSYVGAEGPYYTASETDILLNAKQDTLIAGSNIQIAADGKTISATDTTYSNFTGATASTAGAAGLVPAPAAGAQNKVLKGDGTWKDEGEVTIFYVNQFSSTTGNITFYKDENRTNAYTYKEVEEAIESGATEVRAHYTSGANYTYDAVFTPLSLYVRRDSANPGVYSDYRIYFKGNYTAQGDDKLVIYLFIPMNSPETNAAVFNPAYTEFITNIDHATTTKYGIVKIGDNLTTDSSNKLIAKTMTGATASTAGAVGVVPAPAAGDEGKYLKGDGTWATVSGGTSATKVYIDKTIDSGSQDHSILKFYSDVDFVNVMSHDDVVALARSGNIIICTTRIENNTRVLDAEFYPTRMEVYPYTWNNVPHEGVVFTCLAWSVSVSEKRMFVIQPYMDPANKQWIAYRAYIQDQLTAGSNIQISGTTISAPTLVGATSSANGTAGVVPQPLIADEDKFLKGDGTWGDVDSVTTFYIGGAPGSSSTYAMYKDVALTTRAQYSDFLAALASGGVMISQVVNGVAKFYYDVMSYGTGTEIYTISLYHNDMTMYSFAFDTATTIEWFTNEIQPKLTAGTGITISSGNVISASGAVTNNINSADWNALWQ